MITLSLHVVLMTVCTTQADAKREQRKSSSQGHANVTKTGVGVELCMWGAGSIVRVPSLGRGRKDIEIGGGWEQLGKGGKDNPVSTRRDLWLTPEP